MFCPVGAARKTAKGQLKRARKEDPGRVTSPSLQNGLPGPLCPIRYCSRCLFGCCQRTRPYKKCLPKILLWKEICQEDLQTSWPQTKGLHLYLKSLYAMRKEYLLLRTRSQVPDDFFPRKEFQTMHAKSMERQSFQTYRPISFDQARVHYSKANSKAQKQAQKQAPAAQDVRKEQLCSE